MEPRTRTDALWLLGFAILPVFTFYLPLIYWAIPRFQTQSKLRHNVPVKVLMQHSLANEPIVLPCPPMKPAVFATLYQQAGICFPPTQFEGTCNNRTVQVTWIDITYETDGQVYRDPFIITEAPKPLNLLRYEEICSRDWLFDPVEVKLVDNSRKGYCGGQTSNETYESCQVYIFPLILILVAGSGLGSIPISSLVAIYVLGRKLYYVVGDLYRERDGYHQMPLKEIVAP